jgi:hypothetical protein
MRCGLVRRGASMAGLASPSYCFVLLLCVLAVRGGAPMKKLEWIGVGIRPPEKLSWIDGEVNFAGRNHVCCWYGEGGDCEPTILTSSSMFMSMSGNSDGAGRDMKEAGEFTLDGSVDGDSASLDSNAGEGGSGAWGCSIRKGRVWAR